MANNQMNNSRKYAAVALGLIGVAGLSIASASTLNVTAASEVGIGVDTFAACDDSVAVDYDYNATTYTITDIDVTGIAAACATEGADITLKLQDDSGSVLYSSSAETVAGTTHTFDASGSNIPLSTNLGDVTVVIG